MSKELLERAQCELIKVLASINDKRIHFDGDDFHELLRDIAVKLAEQPAQQEPVYHLKQYGDVTKEQLDRYMATGDINPQPAQQEPFGYFKAEPFGWTDCAETDEGAVALYTTPQAQRKPLDLTAAIEYADARWADVDVPVEWCRHFADALQPAQQGPVFCEYCGGNDEDPQDHCMDCTRPRWEPVTQELLNNQHPWLYEPMWIASGSMVEQGYYEWRQGHNPDRFITDGGEDWAFNFDYVMPIVQPPPPTPKEENT